ncbi:hypothetical protein KY290_003749 [Solanum tuberosum]|uniref:Uncharacterized protein n=1 Tax=Solanum tuberosum TaxID=4113 RepID=A0ABQ7WTS6_SOLTU|nr:hypothetical protein KY284_003918 [Solanum tuberosum]KAH0732904.1 hypothetical protein KY289_004092 [Solanum tuberosum]KAH0784151.1 hypothetical protein KY290_003749 [Solanum tuberosum]
MATWGAFFGTRVMEIVKKHDSGGLVWKRIKLTSTRKANAKKRLRRVWQNEAVLRACSEAPPSETSEIMSIKEYLDRLSLECISLGKT